MWWQREPPTHSTHTQRERESARLQVIMESGGGPSKAPTSQKVGEASIYWWGSVVSAFHRTYVKCCCSETISRLIAVQCTSTVRDTRELQQTQRRRREGEEGEKQLLWRHPRKVSSVDPRWRRWAGWGAEITSSATVKAERTTKVNVDLFNFLAPVAFTPPRRDSRAAGRRALKLLEFVSFVFASDQKKLSLSR